MSAQLFVIPPPFVNFQSHVTPLNMQSCFVNDEFVVWVDNSGKAPSPPLARGAKGVAKGSPGAPGPIDPSTGKPLFSLVGNLVRGGKKGKKLIPSGGLQKYVPPHVHSGCMSWVVHSGKTFPSKN